jgi:multidrug efflux pump subunit AcrA (membrane-fusion protein)
LPEAGPTAAPLFRAEAIAHRARAHTEAHVLALTPRWTRWTYWLLLSVLGIAAIFSVVARINEYASGPAVIRLEGRRDVTARFAGTVANIGVQPGQRVADGDLLVTLYGAQEAAELERTRREFDLELVKLLRDPSDAAARAALTSLRAQRELAEARLAERVIRAPQAGTISDIRIRAGQELHPGDVLLSLRDADAPCVVVAMLPGNYRPQLRPGMPLRLELDGYRYAYREVVIDSIGDEIIGPAELKRYFGPELGDTMEVSGPTLLVQAHLPSNTFRARGEQFHYYDGMRASAEVRVRAASVLVTLVPGLRAVLEATGG